MNSGNKHTFIIAEAGVNHNGSIELAKELIDAAHEAGADAVKFQSFKAENLVSKNAVKAEYQARNTGNNESQFEMIKKLELDQHAHQLLHEYCGRLGLMFLSTPFDSASLELLVDTFDLPLIKISSGEITNAPFLLEIAQTGKSVILSTGMSTLGDIEQALAVLAYGYMPSDVPPSVNAFKNAYCDSAGQAMLQQKVSLLHCTTEYPAPFEDVNLRAMDTLISAFSLPVGLSDHTKGIAIPVAAVARGASIIEKHFTIDKTLPGPDHRASLDPIELGSMVDAIRQVEQALGRSIKVATASEIKNRAVARKSLVALKSIQKGEVFTVDNLGVKRPGDGISPVAYWDMLGRAASKDYQEDELVTL